MMRDPNEFRTAWVFRTLGLLIRGKAEKGGLRNPFETLHHLRCALDGRSVTKPADEALCLGTLLGLDTARIIEGPVAQRMNRFWSLLTSVPAEVIFYSGDHIKDPGYRWAPASLLQETLPQDEMSPLDVNPGKLLESGLLLQLPWMIIRAYAPLSELVWLRDRNAKMRCWIETDRDADHDYSRCDVSEIDPAHHLAYGLILSCPINEIEQNPSLYNGICSALLVSVYRIDKDIIYVKSLHMGLLTLNPPENMAEAAPNTWQNIGGRINGLFRRGHTWWRRLKAKVEHESFGISQSDGLISGKQYLADVDLVNKNQKWCVD